MLASRSICAQCRSKLLASGATIGTVRPSSTMSSASAATADHDPKTTTTTTSRPAQAQPSGGSPKTPRLANRGAKDPRKRALDLFESTISKSAPAAPASGPMRDVNKIYQLAEKVRMTLSNREQLPQVENATRCWKLLATEVMPVAREYPDVPTVLFSQVGFALRHVADAKLANVHAAELPGIADICKLLADFGQRKAMKRLEMVQKFLNAILAPRPDAPDSESSPVVEERFLEDLVEFWKHLSGLKRTESGLNYPTKFWLTSRPDLRGLEEPVGLFPTLIPNFAENEIHGLGSALVTTYVLLSDPTYAETKAKQEAKPLLAALEPIVKRFDRERLRGIFDQTSHMWKFVEPRADWRVIHMAPEALRVASATNDEGQGPAQRGGGFSYALWHKRFSIAYRGNDHAVIQQAWRDLNDPANDKDRAKNLKACPELFDYILHISCHKSRYETTIYTNMISEVLAYMRNIGLEPSIKTYTAMMEGWKKAKRLEPIENLWHSITAAGVRLDEHIWSSRISAYGSLGTPWSGLKALTHMDRAWQAAVEKHVPELAVKPGIASVNAAISGLLRRDRMEYVNKTLAWAKERGIQPDIYTFNMLLAWMLKRGAGDQADKLLASMKPAGVAPDGATFTIILEAALENLPARSPHEQRAAIDNVFREMAACGIEPNQETYGKMLSTLAREGDDAQVAVATVLSRLRGSGMQPSTEICTMLVDFYVSRSQPDLESIRALVADRRSRTRALTDRIFWETVIKQYHRAGDLEGALEIFHDLDDWGIRCGLPLLEPLLRSLVHRQDWDAATKLVSTVRRQASALASDPDNRYWKHAFWAVAKDYELLESI